MPSEADVLFAQLLADHGLATDPQIRAGLAAVDRIAEMGVLVNLAEILVAHETIDPAKAADIARIQLRKTQIGLLRSHLATLKLTKEEDRRIGNMAAHNGLVTTAQLDDALRIQGALRKEKLDRPIGVILVDKAYLAPEVVESLLELQACLKAGAAADPGQPLILAHEDLTFCAAAVEEGLLTSDHAQQAIAAQRQMYEKLRIRQPMSEVVYGLKMLEPEPIAELGKMVAARRKGATQAPLQALDISEEQDHRLGRVLTEKGLATEEQVSACLEVQKRMRTLGMDRKLGEILLIMGFAGRTEVLGAIEAQKERRTQVRGKPVTAAAGAATSMEKRGRASSGSRRAVPARSVAAAPKGSSAKIALMLAGAGVLMALAGIGGYLATRARTAPPVNSVEGSPH